MPKKSASRPQRRDLGQCTYTSPVLHKRCRSKARVTRKIGNVGTGRLCQVHAENWDENVRHWPELTNATRRQFAESGR